MLVFLRCTDAFAALFDIVCCVQIAVTGAAGGRGIKCYNNMARHFVTPAAPLDTHHLFHCHSISFPLTTKLYFSQASLVFQNK